MNKREFLHSGRWQRNREHWERTLDSANLGGGPASEDIERQLALYETADVRWALDQLGPLDGKIVIDLGGGLALAAILMARRGARVVIVDLAASRLKLARENVRAAGVENRIFFAAASGSEMPFPDASIDCLYTKSVLIHTPLEKTAQECARVLAKGGRAAFIEPMQRNPFVNFYRRFFAPKVWQSITTYFGFEEIRILREAMERAGGKTRLRPFYFTGFMAAPFSFMLKCVTGYRIAERILMVLDNFLFTIMPGLKKRAWFSVMVFRK